MIAKGSRGTEVGPEDPLRLQIPKQSSCEKRKAETLEEILCSEDLARILWLLKKGLLSTTLKQI